MAEQNFYFWLMISVVVFEFAFDKILGYLNFRSWKPSLPDKAKEIYPEETYARAKEYFKTNYSFGILVSLINFSAFIIILFSGGFGWLDSFVSAITNHPVLKSLFFFGFLGLAVDLFFTPFTLYRVFVIEEKFGFNRMTLKTYFADKLKSYILGAIVGGGLLVLVVLIYHETGKYFWLLIWGVVILIMLFATMFYASWIVPLFNKLTPMPEGELKNAIEKYCKKVKFPLTELYIMDGSRRSSRANAFFSGLGPKKKIVLFDTLIEKHSTAELVAVLAHEIGHFKKKHTLQTLIAGIIQSGIMFFILSLFIGNPSIASALGAENNSFHIDIVAFGILYFPLSLGLGMLMNILSRRNEFEADHYAKITFSGKPLQTALKKLSTDNLSNPVPDPAYVFVHYSHPPLLERLERIRSGEDDR